MLSGPFVMRVAVLLMANSSPVGEGEGEGVADAAGGVKRPMKAASDSSVNQMLPSGPAVMPLGGLVALTGTRRRRPSRG